MKPWEQDYGIPEGGTGVASPPPQSGWKVSQADQAQRDLARRAIIERELADNPNDVALQREVTAERGKAPAPTVKPWERSYEKPQQSAQAQQPTAAYQSASFARRVFEGFNDPIIGAAQIADKVLVNPIRQLVSPGASSMEDVVRERDAAYQAPQGIDAARMVGNVANPLSWAGGGSASPLRAAVAGAAQSSLAPVSADEDFARAKAQQAGTGAILGTVLAKTLRGIQSTPEAQALMAQGVQPTVGQALGGMANSMEQKATSIPLVGDAINYARKRAQGEFQQQVIQRATNGAAKTLDDANAYASKLYDDVVPYLRPNTQTVINVQQAVRDAMNNPEMTDQGKQILSGLVDKHFANLGQLVGPAIKNLDSEFGYLGRKYAAGDPASRTLSNEIYNVLGAFRSSLEQGLPQELQGALREANSTYRQLIPINKAASQRADEVITPRALQKTLARQARTDVTRMRPDDLIDSAVAVLPSNVPDSGTAGRIMLGGGAIAGGILPQTIAGGVAAGLGATRPVQRALLGNTAWQRALQPYDAQIAAATAAALRNANRKQQSGNE